MIAVAVALVAASIVVLASTNAHAVTPGSPANFTLSGAVSGLIPGVETSLMLTASNLNAAPITVTSVTVTITSVSSATTTSLPCNPTNLSIPGASYSAGVATVTVSQLVLAGETAPITLPILLLRSAPNDCQVATFNFSYGGSANYVAVPASCTGSYANTIYASPTATSVTGTNQGDFIFAYGYSSGMTVSGLQGSDCLDVGDFNNTITDGNNDDVVLAGNGKNSVTLGNGTDVVILGAGSGSAVTVGNGNDHVTIGSGSNNTVTLGNGADTVTIQGGSNDTINGGNASETIYLGSGTYNTYIGQAQHPNTCHLPAPGNAAAFHDTITHCTVVSP